jgi:hypothetical protein
MKKSIAATVVMMMLTLTGLAVAKDCSNEYQMGTLAKVPLHVGNKVFTRYTAFRKASNLAGESNPNGSGKERLCCTDVPGSSSQTTWSSSPRASSSMEESITRCCPVG